MSVNVSIPTILRTHTGGEKRVTASGDTLEAVITDLEANYSGITERLIDNGKLHRFVNIYVNDEDVRFSPPVWVRRIVGMETLTVMKCLSSTAQRFSRVPR